MASAPSSFPGTLDLSPPETEPDPTKPAVASSPLESECDPTKPAVKAEGDGGGNGEKEAEEEEAECGFCIFMKGGGCKESFIAWEKCVEDAEKAGEDVVEKCFQVTSLLKKCMDEHADYYEPVLKAEQAMADAVAAEIQESSPESSEQAKAGAVAAEFQESSPESSEQVKTDAVAAENQESSPESSETQKSPEPEN
ncbi:hypothetical protein DsansV1_C38g0234921 [Dioscorea sansibarensis]